MNYSFKKLSCAIAASALLSACGSDDDSSNSNNGNANNADEFVATLESTSFPVTADSLDGTWVAVSNTTATYSATTQSLSVEDAFSFTSVKIFMIDESEDGASVSVKSCSGARSPATLDLDQNTGSFQITAESSLIDYLQGSALVVVESNTKLTVGEFNTVESSPSYSENGTSTSTLIKISDSFTRSFGTVSANGITTTASCFYYESGAGDISLTENGTTQQGGYSYEFFEIDTPEGYTELSRSTGTSGDFIDTEYSGLHAFWPTYIDADSEDEGTSSVINISENGPLNYAGSAEFTETEATTTLNFNLSLLNN
jgi:hypothetical protein